MKDPLLSSGVLHVPVLDPNTGECDYSQVDVRARPVPLPPGAATLLSMPGWTYEKLLGIPEIPGGKPQHLFIIYTDKDGKQTQFRAGPAEPHSSVACNPVPSVSLFNGVTPGRKDCVLWGTPQGYPYFERGSPKKALTSPGDLSVPAEDAKDREGNCIGCDAPSKTVIIPSGFHAHGIDACFGTISDEINKAQIHYDVKGPNSNSFVKTLLHKCWPWPWVAENEGLLLPVPISQVPGWDWPDLVACEYSKSDNTCR